MTEEERVARFVAAVKDDPRVLGVATIRADVVDSARPPWIYVVTTWDGLDSIPRELPALVRAAFAETPTRTLAYDNQDGRFTVVAAEGWRIEVQLMRAGDLKPPGGASAAALYDPRGLIESWIAVSRKSRDQTADAKPESTSDEHLLRAVNFVYFHEQHLGRLRGRRVPAPGIDLARLSTTEPVEAAVRARIEAKLSAGPYEVADRGNRDTGGDDPDDTLESFLRTADGEGFKGDRVLFGEATKHLRDLSKREPVFDQGFVVPTFDAVEAAFALGEAVGGCQPPLVPGVYVGVGVTPKDALEFWAAPFVRDPTCSVACVDDVGDRDVVERAKGRDPMVASLVSSIDAAWERLPALIDRARDAAKEQVEPSAALAPLHLPKSFVERAKRRGAGALMCSRLTVALAVARAGHDCAPLVARKLGLAAGRVLAAR